jgi:hypothetical protein
MIDMFMRNKDRTHFFYRQPRTQHPLFNFFTGNSHINKHSISMIADVITIAVAAGSDGGNE